jgi:uncharacterized membrane protein YfcA
MLYLIPVLIGLSLGLLGGGGTLLAVPALIYIFGFEPKQAIAVSLLIVGISSFITSIVNIFKNKIELKSILYFGLVSMLASYGSSRFLVPLVSAKVQVLAFIALIFIVAFRMIQEKPQEPKLQTNKNQNIFLISSLALIMGSITGFVGVGGGFLIVPALVVFMNLEIDRAIASSLVIVTMQSLSAFIAYLNIVNLDLNFTLIFTALVSLSSLLGSYLSNKIDQKLLKTGFVWFLFLMAGFMLINSFM